MRAYDVWMITCYLFAFASLCELALASLLDVWLGPLIHSALTRNELASLWCTNPFNTRSAAVDAQHQMYWGDQLDNKAILFMPVAFAMFNMAFWMICIEARDRTWRVQ